MPADGVRITFNSGVSQKAATHRVPSILRNHVDPHARQDRPTISGPLMVRDARDLTDSADCATFPCTATLSTILTPVISLAMSNLQQVLAPTGKLRAAINLGNPLLAKRDDHTGEPFGVSVDLAREFASKLDLELELVVVDAAGKSFQVVSEDQADFGFFALDPLRAETIAFSAPYLLIEGFYLVHNRSKIRTNQDVDQPQNRVAVGKGSAYDLFLTRTLKTAEIIRSPTSPTVVQKFLEQNLEVAAGVKQQLQADIKAHADLQLRLLDEPFMEIQQAVGVPRSRGDSAAAALVAFIEDMKTTGFVKESLQRHRIFGATVP